MKRLRNPLVWFVGAILVLTLRDIYFVITEKAISEYGIVESLLVYYPVACWVYMDAKKRKIGFPSDLVLIFMILFLPAYLYQTRRWKGLGQLLLWVLGLCVYYWFESQILYALSRV